MSVMERCGAPNFLKHRFGIFKGPSSNDNSQVDCVNSEDELDAGELFVRLSLYSKVTYSVDLLSRLVWHSKFQL